MKDFDLKDMRFVWPALVYVLAPQQPAFAQSLPVPCGSCGATPFVTSGDASYAINGVLGTVQQQTDRVILNWENFNIGAGNTLEFRQPNADSAALNRIFQSDPTQILGRLEANGQVYLINQNGIIFGAGSQVNVRALTASTLGITDDVFNRLGIEEAVQQGLPAFAHDASNGLMGAITIEGGAVLQTPEGGRVLVLAPEVVNRGTIHTPGGQTTLAASEDRVYITTGYRQSGTTQTPRSLTDLRGILVEVDTGGSVANLGQIIAERGDIGLVGLAVNQSGLVRATTSVSERGSIRLVARDRAVPTPGSAVTADGLRDKTVLPAGRTGTLVLGENSVTEIVADTTASGTAVDSQPQAQSVVELMGSTIRLDSGAQVIAPGGLVNVTATTDPRNPARPNQLANASSFSMAAGSRIDVSGLDSAVLPMSRNVIEVELRGSQLADSPIQRDGPLRNARVNVDIRTGTPLANVEGNLSNVERTLAERLAIGGSVSVISEGRVDVAAGAEIDFSGGAVTYEGGYVNTTRLVTLDGRIVDIADASPDVEYRGILGEVEVDYSKWGISETFGLSALSGRQFMPGYVEGKDAGSAAFQARMLNLGGTLRGDVVTGVHQRFAPTESGRLVRSFNEIPLGGAVTLGDARAADGDLGLAAFDLDSFTALGLSGVSRLAIYSNGAITLAAGTNVEIPNGGSLNLTGGRIDLAGSVTGAGADISAIARATGSTAVGTSEIIVADGAVIDTSGRWVNDRIQAGTGAAEGPVFIAGGDVTLRSEGNLLLMAGSSIDASGGAHLTTEGDVVAGTGGNISLAVDYLEPRFLQLDGVLRSDAIETGGTLSLSSPAFVIGNGSATSAVGLTPEFFSGRGFSAYELTASHGGIEVAPGTTLSLVSTNLVLDSLAASRAVSDTDLQTITSSEVLPDYLRDPVSIALTHKRAEGVAPGEGAITVGTGAMIAVDAGGTIAIDSDARVIVDGTLSAPGGTISVVQSAPTSGTDDGGYDPLQALWLGANARLLAQGVFRELPSPLPGIVRTAEVVHAGSVTVDATRSYVFMEQGAVIDVSGRTSDDYAYRIGSTYQTMSVNADAGSIAVRASEGGVLAGTLVGQSGEGAGARAGTLSITLDGRQRQPQGGGIGANPFPDLPRSLVVGTAPLVSPVPAGQSVPLSENGTLSVSATTLAAGGFDALSFAVTPSISVQPDSGRVRFDGDVALNPQRQIVISAPVIASSGGMVDLAAAHVVISSVEPTTAAPLDGTGQLAIEADLIDLVGNVTLQGFGGSPVLLHSTGDIRLTGTRASNPVANGNSLLRMPGQLRSAADLVLRADQIYPTTLSDYAIRVERAGGQITFQGGDTQAPAAPLSANGRLAVTADTIVQQGIVRAPFGELDFTGTQRLTLASGSLTSVSGSELVVPFGATEIGGEDWIYRFSAALGQEINAVPGKRINLTGDALALEAGSVVDVGGGGDLFAAEFVPGPGGSGDILGSEAAAGSFAILPLSSSVFASFDPTLAASVLTAGNTIRLDGAQGLPAGEYAVLPPAYALLPGARLVTPQAAASLAPGESSVRIDGSLLVTGRYAYAGADLADSLASTFLVEGGEQLRARARYLESFADDYFAGSAATLNQDAGQMVLTAATQLELGGRLAASTTGGRGTQVDILADRLNVVGARTTAQAGTVDLLASDLNVLAADSLLLGATRVTQADGRVRLETHAQSVNVAAGANLVQEELILVASNSVDVRAGASIAATGTSIGAEAFSLAGDAAIVRASGGEQVTLARSSVAGSTGSVFVEAGAQLTGSGSVLVDASTNAVLDGAIATNQGAISLGASRISLGSVPGGTAGLVLAPEDIQAFNSSVLRLVSRSTVDVFGGIDISTGSLEIQAAGIGGYGGSGEVVRLAADTLFLGNPTGVAFSGAGGGVGQLSIAGRILDVGAGDFATRGFSGVTVAATDQVAGGGEASASRLLVASDLSIDTPRVTVTAGGDFLIASENAAGQSVGAVSLVGSPTVAATAHALGGRLEIRGAGLLVDTELAAPSGEISLVATGAGGIQAGRGARLDVAGRDIDFGDALMTSRGGTVRLNAAAGPVILGAGSLIDVGGAPAGSDAGAIEIRSGAQLSLDSGARLAGNVAEGYRGGRIGIHAGELNGGLATLVPQLQSGQFNTAIALRIGSGDVNLVAGTALRAHEVALAADAGNIVIDGLIDARSAEGGVVNLAAGSNVSLSAGARIDASATASGSEGGHVAIGTLQGSITLAAGSSINVMGTDAQGQAVASGSVALRAPRVGIDGVAIAALTGEIAGARRIDVEAFSVYQSASINSGVMASIAQDSSDYMANAATVLAGLGGDTRLHLLAGEEIQSVGDMVVDGPLDFLGRRYGGEAGVLTLRAGGNLTIAQSISDAVVLTSSMPGSLPDRDTVQTGSSWSYRLVGGADLDSAELLATGDTGDLTLASGVRVRTGTGDIALAAGRDIHLVDATAAVYTMGESRGPGVIPTGAFGVPPEFMQDVIFEGDFLHNGGDISLNAGRDIVGAHGGQFITDWLARAYGDQSPGGPLSGIELGASWAVNTGAFRQNLGALGGGNVQVHAARTIDSLSIMLPTTGQPDGPPGTAPVVAGGGNLEVTAGADILGGMFYVERGTGAIVSGGTIGNHGGSTANPVIALGDASVAVMSRNDLKLESVLNPFLLPQSADQGMAEITNPLVNYFSTYSAGSRFSATSMAGHIELRGDDQILHSIAGNRLTAETLGYFVMPGGVTLTSLQGDVAIGNSFSLFPSPSGNLDIVAAGSIGLAAGGERRVELILSGADPGLLPSFVDPATSLDETGHRLSTPQTSSLANAAVPVHRGDPTAARFIARDGVLGVDSAAVGATPSDQFTVYLSKRAEIRAGTISNLNLAIQHANPADITVIASDSDIRFPTQRSSDANLNTNANRFLIEGPGRLDVIAAGSIDLGASEGILSAGNRNNVALPHGGATISVLAGMDPDLDYAEFIDKYLDSELYRSQLSAYLQSMGIATGESPLATFKALSRAQQRPLILGVYFNELRESGIAATDGDTSKFARGFEARAALFGDRESSGEEQQPADFDMFLSRVTTLDGGDINLVVPHGLINAGVADTSVLGGGSSAKLGRLGLIIEGEGNLNAALSGSFLVNETRVFVLDGGDILIWSDEEDIDAGGGAKTALDVQEADVRFSFDGLPISKLPPKISGSGIRTAVTTVGRKPGNIYLFAPRGIVNAGDAGIVSAGNITIAAVQVVGADNISVGGVAVGVPVEAGGLGASLSAASAAGSGAASAAAGSVDTGEEENNQAAPLSEAALSFLEVFVVGLGEDTCSPQDTDCLQRQQSE